MRVIAQNSRHGWAVSSRDRTALDLLGVASPLYQRVEDALAPTGLSYRQFRVLESLRASRSVSAASEHIPYEVVDGLEAAALVRRVWIRGKGCGGIELTPLGQARAEQAATRLRAVASDFAARLGAPEALDLRSLLTRVGASRD